LREIHEGAGRAIAEGVEGGPQCGQQDVNPLIGFALAHAKQTSLDDLEAVGLEISQEEEQAIWRRG
jgi:hypothetical protein